MSSDQYNIRFKDILDQVSEIIPSYRRLIFKTIVIGLLVGKNKRTISGIFQQFACVFLGTPITQKRFYSFLESSSIKWLAMWHFLAQFIRPFAFTEDRILLALDDTSYGKTGKKIQGCATHFDHANKVNASPYIFGHCRVVAGVLTFVHGRWACLPFAQQNFIPVKKKKNTKIHADLQSKTILGRKLLRRQEWQKTKSGIAAVLVNRIRTLFHAPTLVVCDSWFGTYTLLRELRRPLDSPSVDILTRLRVSCVLYDRPAPPQEGARGRHRKYGDQLAPINELAAAMRPEAVTQKILIYGKQRDCTYSERIVVSKALKCPVKLVFIHRSKNRFFPLVTTDLTLSAQQMIEYYSARWKIESAFKELKHELGAIHSQCRKEQAVENHFNLCCMAMTTAWAYTFKQQKPPKRQFPGRRVHAFAFADVRRQINAELRDHDIFTAGCQESLKHAIKLVRHHIFRAAA